MIKKRGSNPRLYGYLLQEMIYFFLSLSIIRGFLGGSESKASACNEGDPGLILGWEDPLEKEMASHSSTLTWKIPWMEKLGRLQSMHCRVGHN